MSLQELQDKLGGGFYVDNLYVMAGLCKTLALDSDYPVPFFVIRQVLLEIARDWEDRPLPVGEAKLIENKIKGPLMHLLQAIRLDASKETVYNILDDVVTAYLVA